MSSDDLSMRPRPEDEVVAKSSARRKPAADPAPEPTAGPEAVPSPPHTTPKVTYDRVIAWLTDAWASFLAGSRHVAQSSWQHIRHAPRWVAWVIGGVLLVLLAIILFLANPNWDWARPTVASIISGRTHRPVKIDGHLRVHLFSFTPTATVGGLKIGQPAWANAALKGQNLADISSLTVKAKLMPLFAGKIVLPRLQIDRPTVAAFQDKDGRANWDFSDGADKGKPTKLPPIENFIINDGHLTITSLQRKMTFTGTVNAHEKAGAGSTAFALTGDGSLNGNVFRMEASGGPLLNVKASVPYPFALAIRSGDTRINARGRVLHPFNLGGLDGAISLSGSNLADVYDITGITLPNTPRYELSAHVRRDGTIWNLSSINGRVGSSDLEGTLKVDRSREHGRPDVTADLRSRVLDWKDMGALFGATNANAPTAPKMAMAPNAPQAARRLMPDASLDAERIRGMDGRLRYRALSVRAIPNMPLRAVSLGARLDHGLLTLDPIDFTFPQGRLTGTAKIDARGAVQKDAVDLRLTGTRLQDFLPKIGGSEPLEGILDARVRVAGTGNSVHKAASTADGQFTAVIPGGTIRQSLAELMGIDATKGLFQLLTKDQHQTDVRCAIADFKVHDGVMQAQSIVFDTGVVLVNGSGTVNMNDESLKLTFKGKPKKFRLVRINAPILVGGHLTAPKFGISAGPAIVQGGLAAIFQSILPFVNIDTAKNANCAALMSQAQSQGAPTTTHTAPRKPNPTPVH